MGGQHLTDIWPHWQPAVYFYIFYSYCCILSLWRYEDDGDRFIENVREAACAALGGGGREAALPCALHPPRLSL